MNTNPQEAGAWQWSEATPQVQSIIWVFTHREIPVEPRGFFDIMDKAFGVKDEEVSRFASAGKRGLQEMVVGHLGEYDPKDIEGFIEELGEFAGNGAPVHELASRITGQITSGEHATAAVAPMLKMLSDVAVSHIANEPFIEAL